MRHIRPEPPLKRAHSEQMMPSHYHRDWNWIASTVNPWVIEPSLSTVTHVLVFRPARLSRRVEPLMCRRVKVTQQLPPNVPV